MNNHINDAAKSGLPKLPKLPVIRDTYCSQEMTDKLVSYLCQKRPDLVKLVFEQEKRPLPEGRDELYAKAYGNIIEYLRDLADHSVLIPESRLGMLDLLYELSRRIRSDLNLVPVLIIGNPLAPSPDGPFPDLPSSKIKIVKNPDHQLSQDEVNEVVSRAYTEHPEIFYEFSEQARRLMRSYEITQAFGGLIKNFLPEGKSDPWLIASGAASTRINKACNLPETFEDLKERFAI